MLDKVTDLYRQYKTPILYSGGSIAKALSQMIAGFVVAKFVTPKDFGLWNTLSLGLNYSLLLQAGLINGLNRELPYLFGKGEEEKAHKMAGTVLTFNLFASIFVILCGITTFLIFQPFGLKISGGILGITILVPITFYQNYLFSTFRSKDSFLRLSWIQLIHAGVNLLTIVFVVYFTFYGLIVKAIVLTLIYVLLMHLYRPLKVHFIWDKESFIKLLKVGFPIFILSYIETIASTADRMFLLQFGSLEKVGIYSFGFYALSSLSIFPSSIASYIYPKMTYNYGKTGDKKIMWQYVKKVTFVVLLVLIPISIIGYFICPPLINLFFPEYSKSSSIVQILLVAGVFSGAVIGVNALWSMKSWKFMISYQLCYSALLIVLPLICILNFENQLIGASIGILIAHTLNFGSALLHTYFATHR